MTDEYFRRAIVVRVKDGDTIVADVDLGFKIWVRHTFRFYGIQAPEKNTPEGKKAAKYLRGILPIGADMVLEIIRDPSGKYSRTFDRYVAIPYRSDVNVCKLMVKMDHARKWTKFKRFKTAL